MHAEFYAKFAENNRGLKHIETDRQLSDPEPEPPSEWKKLFAEFQTKLAKKKQRKEQ